MKLLLLYPLICGLFLQILPAQDSTRWHTQLTEAQAQAQQKSAPIFMVFSGSDWCKPCMRFKNQVLEHPDFLRYADQHLVLLQLDFPAKKKNKLPDELRAHHEALAERYNPQGAFPAVLLLNAEGQELHRLDYRANLGPADYIQKLQSHLQP
ncbi:MAG: thioredoxin family protein [Bacteroidota bacterium]